MLDRSQWWWEARLHPLLGTVETRVLDAQTMVAETAAIAAVVHSLITSLAERHDAGEALPVAPSWRIAENRWSACRHGLDGTMADPATGEQQPTRVWAARLLDDLDDPAQRAGCAQELRAARRALPANGAVRQRAAAAERGSLAGLTAWLAERFLG
jgi:carboxylate-amine ligase